MWSILGVIFAALFGFGTGTAGFNQFSQQQGTSSAFNACYQPQPEVRLTLNWPGDFTNLSDNRVSLNPQLFGSLPPRFNSEDACKPMILSDTNNLPQQSRAYILVRQNVRVSSCKVDELAGPYNASGFNCHQIQMPVNPSGLLSVAILNRGTCNIERYPDLRKIAEVKQGSETLEIFWNPFTHNAKCGFDPNNPNCGTEWSFVNLRSFIYVLRNRDAFTSNDPAKNCQVYWDAGSTNKGACSHYFDVYMAEDLYYKLQSPVPASDPDYKTYQFVKQTLENCQENNPIQAIYDVANPTFPPQFIDTPFVTTDLFLQRLGKILPGDLIERGNYQHFVLNTRIANPEQISLVQFAKSTTSISICPPGPIASIPPGTCYSPIGRIYFKKPTNEFVIYSVYSRVDTPQTFYLIDQTLQDPTVYKYSITLDAILDQTKHFPSLQLAVLQVSTENAWTWATPACKPAIYLYPEKETEVNVKLDIEGQLTVSEPAYDSESGWNVVAEPDGTIKSEIRNPNIETNSNISNSNVQNVLNFENSNFDIVSNFVLRASNFRTYPYLYYEADILGVTIPKEGWIVERSNIKDQISKIMRDIGFNNKEIGDFMDYWLPRLTEKPYYFVTLLSEEMINTKEKLTFSTPPDTLIRARVVFEGLDHPISVAPLESIPSHTRSGFTVTDWGGTLIGKSCTDVEMK